MGLMSFITGRSETRCGASETSARALDQAQTPDLKGLRALEGVTYIPVSDANGRMDDDLFDLLCEESAPAQ